MRSNRRTYVAIAAVAVGIVVLALPSSVGQNQRNYEVQTRMYATPQYRTDAMRAIEAYERVMERYMNASERNLATITADISAVAARLEAIDAGLAKLDARLERIERHLGIMPVTSVPDANAPESPTSAPSHLPTLRQQGP